MARGLFLISVFSVSLFSSSALAQSSTVAFNGTILPSCSLVLGTPGVLVPSSDGHELSSVEPGGVSGTATVLSTGLGYQLQVDAPSAFSQAPPDGQPETLNVSYQASGVTIGLVTDILVPLSLGLGLTSLAIDVTARNETGIFPAGTYSADVVVRCVAS